MAEDKVFTQDEVNKLVGEARAQGREQGRKEFEGWVSPEALNTKVTEISDQVKALTADKEALQSQISEKDNKIAKYEIDSVKTRVAREFGLSYEAIGFIQGEDEEAIKKSAESLKSLVGNPAPAPAPPLGNPEPPEEIDGVTKAFMKLNPNLKI